jgi:predicted small lipoprotein YifL
MKSSHWIPAALALLVAVAGCAHQTRVYLPPKEEIVRVVRLTEERDAAYLARPFDPPGPPSIHRDVRFRVEAPGALRGREISLPIIPETEGPLFQRNEFTIRIPACFLDGEGSSEVKNADGTTQISTIDGLSFEAMLVEQMDTTPPSTPPRGPGGAPAVGVRKALQALGVR